MKLLRHPKVLLMGACLANFLLSCIFKSCKVNFEGLEHFEKAPDTKTILMLWHNRISMTLQILKKCGGERRYAAFVSNSRDGAFLATMIERYVGGTTIRVPHDLRHEALRSAIKKIKTLDEIVVMTPDGPRGPRYKVKGGIALAARMSGALIVPMTWNASRSWEFNTWDKMLLPKPFSTINVIFGKPIKLGILSLEEESLILQETLEALQSDRY
jgi:lysophospholipid acyltransferase (LPLAT)-like uncharacterized protein